jgi:alpha-D-ribose 1-methylphosphonate 5-triphosphate synthase subunit PhnL
MSCITIFAQAMSTVTDFLFGISVAVASAEVIETPGRTSGARQECAQRAAEPISRKHMPHPKLWQRAPLHLLGQMTGRSEVPDRKHALHVDQ